MALTEKEWKVLNYLISLTAPFNALTQTIGQSSSPSIHEVYEVYDVLFTHIEKKIYEVERKQETWKRNLQTGLKNAEQKLRKYYGATDRNQVLDNIYTIS